MQKVVLLLRGLVICVVLCFPAHSTNAAEYQITGFITIHGYGINNSRQVAGENGYDNTVHACLWDNAAVQDLGVLGGNGWYQSRANDINNSGQVAGWSTTSGGYEHAFSWDSAGGMLDLGTLGGNYSYAYGLNSSGQVVGEANTGDCEGVACNNAFIWDSSNGMQGLGTLGGTFSAAFDINNSGHVVGVSSRISSPNHAFIWDSIDGMRDIGVFIGADRGSWANAISDVGQVVGFSSAYSSFPDPHYPSTAFIWDESNGVRDLGTLGYSSVATDINSSGQVVGYNIFYENYGFDYYWNRAFIWDSANGMRELKDLIPQGSGWFLASAEAINDAGQIIVSAYNENNPEDETRTVLLTPTAAIEPVRIEGTIPEYFTAIQAAYDQSASGDIILSRSLVFDEDLYFNENKSVTFEGGYNGDYSDLNGTTILSGSMVINDGVIVVGNFSIE